MKDREEPQEVTAAEMLADFFATLATADRVSVQKRNALGEWDSTNYPAGQLDVALTSRPDVSALEPTPAPEEQVEVVARTIALGNNGGEWASHYTDGQKELWRDRAREVISAMQPSVGEAAKEALLTAKDYLDDIQSDILWAESNNDKLVRIPRGSVQEDLDRINAALRTLSGEKP